MVSSEEASAIQKIIRGGRQKELIRTVFCKSIPDSGSVNGVLAIVPEIPGIKIWVGPYRVPDDEYAKAENPKVNIVKSNSDSEIAVYKYPVPDRIWKGFHRFTLGDVAQGNLLWPIFHSLDPTIFGSPEMLLGNYKFPEKVDFAFENLEESWKDYKEFLKLGNEAIQRLKDQKIIDKDEKIWVQDFHTGAVQGAAFTFYIPFPPLDYLRKVTVNGTPLLDLPFFKELMAQYVANHQLITFCRQADLQNFIDVMQATGIRVISNYARGTTQEGGTRQLEVEINGGKKKLALLALPLGVDHKKVLAAATNGENQALRSKFNMRLLEQTGIQPKDVAADPSGDVTLRNLLGDALSEGHKIFLAVTRNDYIKSTVEKLLAAEKYLAEHQEEVGKTHFVFFLQGGWTGEPPASPYQQMVRAKAKELRERFGSSILIVPGGIPFGEFVALTREDNVIGYLGTSRIEGHDISARDAVAANSDKRNAKLAVITTDGTGVSELLKGKGDNIGAFVIKGGQALPVHDFVDNLVSVLEKVTELNNSTEGREELARRFSVMKQASEKASLLNMQSTVSNALSAQNRGK